MSESTFSFKNAELKKIPLALIRENSEALRVEVDKDTPKYKQLVDNVKIHGIMNPISVREIVDPADGKTYYGLIDGLHRYNAAMDAGFESINAQVGDLEEGNLIEAQMMANFHKIETTPMQYTNGLLTLMRSNPMLTKQQVADRLNASVSFIEQRMGLKNLKDSIKELVDSGTLPLSNAYSLSKLPHAQQEELLQAAIAKPVFEFTTQATAVLNELKKAVREGRKADGFKFVPVARSRKMSELKDEIDACKLNPELSRCTIAAKSQNVQSVDEAIAFTLNWVLHLDPATVAADEQTYNNEKAQQKIEAERRKVEREAIKQKAAELTAQTANAK